MTEHSWRPAPDDQLNWFRPPAGLLPSRTRPLDLTVTIPAFTFGISRALESLYFPLYELCAKIFDGSVYLAVAPSEFAERDLQAQKRRMSDSALRFSRDINAAWQRVRPEIDEYNQFFKMFATKPRASEELAGLRRVRANQWFASTRAIFAPAVLLREEGIGQTPPDVAARVVSEAREAVLDRGTAAFNSTLLRIEAQFGANYKDTLIPPVNPNAPATIGPELPLDAPRMYMVRPLLALLARGSVSTVKT